MNNNSDLVSLSMKFKDKCAAWTLQDNNNKKILFVQHAIAHMSQNTIFNFFESIHNRRFNQIRTTYVNANCVL